ncbi:MAG: nucleotidyltransferase family protein [Rikenellaceae bacterium]|nr:nucleotidyltransferase family protein [Rikenellaceae bacterium]
MESIILAGGLGTRLRTEVSDMPKVMASVAGRPFLFYIFKQLEKNNITHAILSLGYMHEIVEEWVQSGEWNFEVSFCVEDFPLGTGGAIRESLAKSQTDNVLVINGDTLFDIPLEEFYISHIHNDADISVALKPMQNFSRYGTVVTDTDGRITEFKEKEYYDNGFINGGIYCIRKSDKIFGGLSGKFSFETEIMEKSTDRLSIFGTNYDNYFIDIGVPEDYNKANKDFKTMIHG